LPVAHRKMVDGVHVNVDAFSNPSDRSFTQFDAAGNVVKKGSEDNSLAATGDTHKAGNGYDAEAQVISDDFKRPP